MVTRNKIVHLAIPESVDSYLFYFPASLQMWLKVLSSVMPFLVLYIEALHLSMPTCIKYFLGFVALTSSYKEVLSLSHILHCLAQTCVPMCKCGMPVSVCVCTHACLHVCLLKEEKPKEPGCLQSKKLQNWTETRTAGVEGSDFQKETCLVYNVNSKMLIIKR